jgi:hypothetical protein
VISVLKGLALTSIGDTRTGTQSACAPPAAIRVTRDDQRHHEARQRTQIRADCFSGRPGERHESSSTRIQPGTIAMTPVAVIDGADLEKYATEALLQLTAGRKKITLRRRS